MNQNLAATARRALLMQPEIRQATKGIKNEARLIFNTTFRNIYYAELMRLFEVERIKKTLDNVFDFSWIIESNYPFELAFSKILFDRLKNVDENLTTDESKFNKSFCISHNDSKKLRELKLKSEFYDRIFSFKQVDLKDEFIYSNLERLLNTIPSPLIIDNITYEKEEVILFAIAFIYNLHSPTKKPLRKIAEELQTSYDKIVQAENFIHTIINNNFF